MWFGGIYILIGIIYTFYVWNKEYKKDYNELRKEGEVEEGMACMLLLVLVFTWPLKFILNLFKTKKSEQKRNY